VPTVESQGRTLVAEALALYVLATTVTLTFVLAV
jgi:hypothetical protein